jgi:1-phosphatidylinositol-4-phosphate 5-kinase
VMNFKSVDTNVTVKSYCPLVFHFIRKSDGVKDIDIINSLDPINNRYQIFKSNQGQKHQTGGKSGSFFFFSQDMQYIIKTISKGELSALLNMLPSFIELIGKKPHSMISYIYGVYTVQMSRTHSINLVV